MVTNKTSGYYSKFITLYGITSLLYVLKVFEQVEYYEECDKIYKGIKEHNKNYDFNLPTNMDIKDATRSDKKYARDIIEDAGILNKDIKKVLNP
jgi:hypothetical protein